MCLPARVAQFPRSRLRPRASLFVRAPARGCGLASGAGLRPRKTRIIRGRLEAREARTPIQHRAPDDVANTYPQTLTR